jgi:hypothetical protein
MPTTESCAISGTCIKWGNCQAGYYGCMNSPTPETVNPQTVE